MGDSKTLANTNLNRGKVKAVPLESENKTRLSTCSYSNSVLKVLAMAIKQLKETKRIQNEKEDLKVSLFTHGMIVYITGPKIFTGELF